MKEKILEIEKIETFFPGYEIFGAKKSHILHYNIILRRSKDLLKGLRFITHDWDIWNP